MPKRFHDRTDAGQQLAAKLFPHANRADVIAVALPRGGVPVAAEVAKTLNIPLDVCLVRKLGTPGHKELAMGAIASGGVRVLNYEILSELNISGDTVDEVAAHELRELQRRDHVYRGDRPPLDISDRVILLIDDGIATGSTMRAAIAILKAQHPARIVVAIPVAPLETCQALLKEVDEVVCLFQPDPLYSIGLWYDNFAQVTDAEVCDLLTSSEVGSSSAIVNSAG
jgi:putative phosphoribosyl transferase